MDDTGNRNDYAPPESDLLPADREIGPDLTLWDDWERRRLTYNIVLFVEVIVVFGIAGAWAWLFYAPFQKFLLIHALGANLCFCVGPVAEGYFRRFGVRGRVVGHVLFGLGMALAMLLTLWSIVFIAFFREVP